MVLLSGHGEDELSALRLAPPPGGPPRPAVVLAHEALGLDEFTRGGAERLVEAGYVVLAPDLYSREGATGPAGTGADPAPAWTAEQLLHAEAGLPDRRAVADLEAAAGALAADPQVDERRIAAMGSCLGGKLAFLLGCQSRRLAAVVDFYGRVRYPDLDADHPVQPLEMSLGLECPLLGVFGEKDASIPLEDVDAMRRQLDAFAKPHNIQVVPGVGRGFLNPLRSDYAPEAAEEAWALALAFLEETL